MATWSKAFSLTTDAEGKKWMESVDGGTIRFSHTRHNGYFYRIEDRERMVSATAETRRDAKCIAYHWFRLRMYGDGHHHYPAHTVRTIPEGIFVEAVPAKEWKK
jgi:hypothetical protein